MKFRHRFILIATVVLGVGAFAGSAWSGVKAATAQHKVGQHEYVVRAGDGGWWQIARAHSVTMQQMLAANHATLATPVRAGQTIHLPQGSHEPAAHAKAQPQPQQQPHKAAQPKAKH
jgi:hypothetical protein